MGSGACASAATVRCMVGAGACEAGGHVAGGVIVSVVASLSTVFAGRVGGVDILVFVGHPQRFGIHCDVGMQDVHEEV